MNEETGLRVFDKADRWWLPENQAELLELLRRGAFGPPHPFGERAMVPSYAGRVGYVAKKGEAAAVTQTDSWADVYINIGGFTWLCLLHGCTDPFVKMSALNPQNPDSAVRFDSFWTHIERHHPNFHKIDVLELAAQRAARLPMPASFPPSLKKSTQLSMFAALSGSGGGRMSTTDAIVSLLVKRPELSFRFVASNELRDFVRSITGNEVLQWPSRDKIVDALDERFATKEKSVKELLQRLSVEDVDGKVLRLYGSGTMDDWSTVSRSNFVSFTWTGISEEWEMLTILMDLMPHPHPHTATSYYEHWLKVKDAWKVLMYIFTPCSTRSATTTTTTTTKRCTFAPHLSPFTAAPATTFLLSASARRGGGRWPRPPLP